MSLEPVNAPQRSGSQVDDVAIAHVSDTALMVAGCRALETERTDALVRDPFAASLAGARGVAMAKNSPRQAVLGFGIAVRSRFIDDWVLDAVQQRGVRTVLSLGAGLDARPYRLDLPRDVLWIEADFAAMLDYKSQVLAQTAPRCRIERVAADLAEPSARAVLWERLEAGPGAGLILAEGLLMYLGAAVVDVLGREAADSKARVWVLDAVSSAFQRRLHSTPDAAIEAVRAPDALAADQILTTLGRHGWVTTDHKNYSRDGFAIARERVLGLVAAAHAAGGRPPEATASAQGAGARPTEAAAPEDPSGVHWLQR